MPTGRVKSYSTATGYGFIIPDEGGADVFVHASEIEKAGLWFLTEGQPLRYDLMQRRRRGLTPGAKNLQEVTA